jgi:hypothetical protein
VGLFAAGSREAEVRPSCTQFEIKVFNADMWLFLKKCFGSVG